MLVALLSTLLPLAGSVATTQELETSLTPRHEAHLLGVGVDHASEHNGVALRYLHAHEADAAYGRSSLAYGVELGVLSAELGRADLATAGLVARGSGFLALPLAVELAAAVARPQAPRLVGRAGVYLSGSYVDVGYAYERPLDGARPYWLATHHLSVRLAVPLWRHERPGELD